MSTLRVLTSNHPLVLALALGLVVAGATAGHAQEFSCDYDARVQIGTIEAGQSPYLNEASGLVQSRTQPDVFWSHQDNSNDERIFAVRRDGTYLGTWDLAVASARDPEDIAIGPGPVPGVDYIYFGDVGYNNGVWGCTPQSCTERDLRVWRAVEPSVDPDQAFVTVTNYPADTITLKFPDAYMVGQRQDVETLMVDPLNGDIYVATKRSTPGMVFRAPFPHSTTEPITMEWVADLPFGGDSQATGGDISADGRFIIIRRYGDGYIWERTPGSSMADALNGTYCHRTGLSETQGEAVAFDVGNSGTFYTTSEGGGSVPIYRYRNVNDDGGGCTVDGDCDDGLFCNGAEICNFSTNVCEPGTAVSCDDSVACTVDSCNEATDSCDNMANDVVCDDGNVCTDDTCSGSSGCQYVDNTDPCDDGSLCTENDVCAGGACQGGSAIDCSDGITCTDDSCDSGLGCLNVDNCGAGETCNLTLDICETPPPAPLLPITIGDDWRYLRGTAEPTPGDLTAWTQIAFDDSTWLTGASGFAYGPAAHEAADPDTHTLLDGMSGNYASVYFRREFHVDNPSTLDTMTLTIDYDDAFVAYVNGVEVLRSDLLVGLGDPPAFDQLANAGGATNHEGDSTEVFDFAAAIPNLVAGTNVLSFQLHNVTLASSDAVLRPVLEATFLSLGCVDNNDCDDGMFCNGAEACVAGDCQSGAPVDCDDGEICSADSCNEATDSCDHVGDDRDGDGVCSDLDGHPDDPDRTGPHSAGTAAAVNQAWQTVWLPYVYRDPVVIVGPPSYNGADPGVAQVQGVGPAGFDLRFAEWEYLDGTHWMAESVSYLVLEKGRYIMDDGSIWEVGSMSLSGSQAWFFKSFSQPFPGNPQVFLTVQTVNSNPVTARARNVKANGFGVALFDEEALTGGHPTEEIGYLAIYSPDGFGEVTVDGALTPYRLQAEPVDRRFASFLGFSIKLHEDRSADQEDWHLDETVALLGLGTRLWAQAVSSNGADPFSLRRIDPVSSSVAVEWGTLSNVDHNWSLVPLAKSYVDPIVVVKPASNLDSEPGALRIRNIDEDSFEVRFEEWSYLDGTHMPERVFYIVAEAGQADLDGLAVEAGKLDTDKVLGPAGWSPVGFATAFASAPAVFASLQTVNEADPAVTRVRQRSTSGFEVTMQEEEASGDGHAMETVGWIAIDTGTAIVEGRDLEIFVTGVDDQPGSFGFTRPLERRYPFLVTDVTTADDEDTCSPRFETVYRLGATVMLQEEQSVDAETDHGTEDLSVFLAE